MHHKQATYSKCFSVLCPLMQSSEAHANQRHPPPTVCAPWYINPDTHTRNNVDSLHSQARASYSQSRSVITLSLRFHAPRNVKATAHQRSISECLVRNTNQPQERQAISFHARASQRPSAVLVRITNRHARCKKSNRLKLVQNTSRRPTCATYSAHHFRTLDSSKHLNVLLPPTVCVTHQASTQVVQLCAQPQYSRTLPDAHAHCGN